MQNIPGLVKKNDVELSANYGSSVDVFRSKGNYNQGIDLHTAWAFGNHFALLLNESLRWEKSSANDSFFENDSSSLSYNRNFTEIGIGYFTSMKNNKRMQLQVFGGSAFGGSRIYDDFLSNSILKKKYHQSRVTKIFIQPAFIFKPGNNFSAALSLRFTEIFFSHIHTNYTLEELNNYLLDDIDTSPVFFWEPAVTYTFGLKNFPVKFRIQGSISILLNHSFIEHRSSNLGVGLVSNFAKHKQKKSPASKK